MPTTVFVALLLTLSVFASCRDSSERSEVKQEHVEVVDSTYDLYSGVSIDTTIELRFTPPLGYQRTASDASSFAAYLRTLPLKPAGARVRYYDGSTKSASGVYDAVIDLDIGNRDLHQCADAIMRLRAEYLWWQGRYEEIHFNFTNGHRVDYSEWMAGKRMQVDGNRTWWEQKASPSNTYVDLWDYLELIFMYAGTASLEKELVSIDIDDVSIGDVLIRGGYPGHAVIVVDEATNSDTGDRVFLLAQSYMPAQEIQILQNPNDPDLSPWYRLGPGVIETPEWEFASGDCKRFP